MTRHVDGDETAEPKLHVRSVYTCRKIYERCVQKHNARRGAASSGTWLIRHNIRISDVRYEIIPRSRIAAEGRFCRAIVRISARTLELTQRVPASLAKGREPRLRSRVKPFAQLAPGWPSARWSSNPGTTMRLHYCVRCWVRRREDPAILVKDWRRSSLFTSDVLLSVQSRYSQWFLEMRS